MVTRWLKAVDSLLLIARIPKRKDQEAASPRMNLDACGLTGEEFQKMPNIVLALRDNLIKSTKVSPPKKEHEK
jgi:hypothetical protein